MCSPRAGSLFLLGVVVAAGLVGAGLFIVGGPKKVQVSSGTRVLCRYGHVVSEDIKTLTVEARDAQKYRIRTDYTICPEHERAELLLRQAAAALKKGDKAEATSLAKKAYATASDVSDPTGLGKKLGVTGTGDTAPRGGSSEGGSGGGGAASGGSEVVSPVDLIASLPSSLSGYELVAEDRSAVSAARRFKGTTARPKELVTYVLYVGGADAYTAWFNTQIKNRYSVGAQNLTVGTRKVYFATDGFTFATAVWRSGGAALQVEAAPRSGSPSALKDSVLAVVKKMP